MGNLAVGGWVGELDLLIEGGGAGGGGLVGL